MVKRIEPTKYVLFFDLIASIKNAIHPSKNNTDPII